MIIYGTIRDTPENYIHYKGETGQYIDTYYDDEQKAREKLKEEVENLHKKLIGNDIESTKVTVDGNEEYQSVSMLNAQYNDIIYTARQMKAQATQIINNVNKREPELIKQAKQELERAISFSTPMLAKGKAYEAFYNNYIAEKDETGKEVDTNYPNTVADLTNKEEVKVLVDQEDQMYTIGPFSMQYPSQYFERERNKNLF